MPELTPIRMHGDDRRLVWLELLGSLLPGDLSVTWVYPGATLAWHRHEHQDDYMVVLRGVLKVGMWAPQAVDEVMWPGDPEKVVQWETLDEHHPRLLRIPAYWWHGYQNLGSEPALVLTYITQHYNPKDEHRMSVADAGVPWERTVR